MSYSQGVLIHNFNEDRYGQDLQRIPRPSDLHQASITSIVHGWKQPMDREEPTERSTKGVDAHLLFGHAGDMHDPHSTMQRREFATATSYFMQDPAKVAEGSLSSERFTKSDEPVHVSRALPESTLAMKRRSKWGDMRKSHAPTPDERFTTSSGAAHSGKCAEPFPRFPRHYHEFTAGYDAVKVTSPRSARGAPSSARGAGSSLRNTASLVLH